MFKIVRDETPDNKPWYFLMCDEACSRYIQGPAPGNPEDVGTQQAFAAEAAKQGWILGFIRHLCPKHAAQHVQKLRESRKLVELASTIRTPSLKLN